MTEQRDPRLKTFLCRYRTDSGHFLHVHDEPSYFVDVLRHAEMGWRMSRTCQFPGQAFVSGDPGVKPVEIVDFTGYDPGIETADDHHRTLRPRAGTAGEGSPIPIPTCAADCYCRLPVVVRLPPIHTPLHPNDRSPRHG